MIQETANFFLRKIDGLFLFFWILKRILRFLIIYFIIKAVMRMNLDQTRLKTVNQIGAGRTVYAKRKWLDQSRESGLHWHEFYEMEIILGGEGVHFLNGREYILKKGAVYFLTPVDFHRVTMKEHLELYNVMFLESAVSQQLLHAISENFEDKFLTLDDRDFTMMCNLADTLAADDKTDAQYTQNIMDAMLRLFLKNLKKQENAVFRTADGKERVDLPVQRSAMFMKLHFRENVSLVDVAAAVHLNPSYFCKIFAQEMGITPKKYLSDLKISYAKKLLTSTDLGITEICFACGYRSVSNFLCYFKKSEGLSPTEYRQRAAAIKEKFGKNIAFLL